LTVTTTVDSVTGDFVIDWTRPVINGAAIYKYLIEIQDKDGNWKTSLATCDGKKLTIVGTMHCTVPMNTLTGEDFQLSYGTLVQVRVTPTNNKGTGPASDPLIFGATIRTVPKAPQKPTRGMMTAENKI